MDILTVRILHIQKYKIYFHFLVYYSTSFINILEFSLYNFFSPWLILCLSILCSYTWNCVLIPLSDASLLLCRNIIDLFVESVSTNFVHFHLLQQFSGRFRGLEIVCAFFFFFWMTLIFLAQFLCLAFGILCWSDMARVGIFAFFLILKEIFSTLCPFNSSCGLVTCGLYFVNPSPYNLLIVFVMKGCWILSNTSMFMGQVMFYFSSCWFPVVNDVVEASSFSFLMT